MWAHGLSLSPALVLPWGIRWGMVAGFDAPGASLVERVIVTLAATL